MRYRRRKSRDVSFPLVIGILLLFSLLLDQVFDQLRTFLLATRIVPSSISFEPRPQEVSRATYSFPQPNAGPRGSEGESSGASLNALALLETERAEVIRQRLLSQRGVDPGEPVAPGPTNPSRFFPEPQHPTLRSGIALRTSPADPPPFEEPRESEWGRTIQPYSPPVDRQLASLPPPPPLPPENRERQPTPNVQPAPQPLALKPADPPRISFQFLPKKKDPSRERLVEACGRWVPESQAAEAAHNCAKPVASEPVDLGGGERIFIP